MTQHRDVMGTAAMNRILQRQQDNQHLQATSVSENPKRQKKVAGDSTQTSLQQTTMFFASLDEFSLRDDADTMEMPVLSLSTKADMETWHWTAANGRRSVVVTPSTIGRATMNDKDMVIFLLSRIMAAVNSGLPPPERVLFRLADYFALKGSKKGINKRSEKKKMEVLADPEKEKPTKDPYEIAVDTLTRLKFTGITEHVVQENGYKTTTQISYIGDWSIVDREPGTGRAIVVAVVISPWMKKVVKEGAVFAISPAYFKLRKPLEKRLYAIARKHVGNQGEWKIGTEELRKKCGSRSTPKEFRRMMNEIIRQDKIPDYRIALSTRADGSDAYRFYSKNMRQFSAALAKKFQGKKK